MRNSALAAAALAAFAMLGASAGRAATMITDVRTNAFSQVIYDKTKGKNVSKVEYYGDTQGVPGSSTRDPWGGATFNSFVKTSKDSVFFEGSGSASKIYTTKNNTVYVKTLSQTMVSFDFVNDTNEDVKFESLITAAGMGYYLANTSGAGCAYSGCPEVTGVSLLKDVAPFVAGSTATDAAKVQFRFSIIDNGTVATPARNYYSVSGSSSLSFGRDSNGKIYSYFNDTLSDASSKLKGFTLASDAGDLAAHGFAWDDTPVSFMLSPGRHTLTYATYVSSEVYSHQLACGANVVAYAGFGDPIGRAGAVESIDSFRADGASAYSLKPTCPANGRIKGLNFRPQTFHVPVVRDGKVVYTPTGAVPEPATWATMILGFSAIGTVLRRRRVMVSAA